MQSRTITLQRDTWNEIDEGERKAYMARANQLGITLKVGVGGLTKSDFRRLPGHEAGGFDPWQHGLRALLGMEPATL